ncbi:MAG: putative toxin-antitoxin system toxin component, PIN family [Pirellulales bacterium]
MRVVVDTNVVVSGLLLPGSVSRRGFNAARTRGNVLVSIATLEELDDVLCRPKFDHYVDEEQRLDFLAAYIREAEHVAVTATVRECRDPSDDKILELAVSGIATHILSGDADLLTLSPFRGIVILTPADFLRELNEPAHGSITS